MRYRRRTTPPRPSDLRKKDGGGTFGRSNSSAAGFEPDRRYRQCIARAGSIRLALPFRIIFPRYSTAGRRYGRRAAGSVSQPQSTRRYGLGPKPILGRTGPSPRLRSQRSAGSRWSGCQPRCVPPAAGSARKKVANADQLILVRARRREGRQHPEERIAPRTTLPWLSARSDQLDRLGRPGAKPCAQTVT